MDKIKKNKNYNCGHRKRLREKFLSNGLSGFHNYEIIELLLTIGTPRKDCKIIAKNLIKKFGSFNAILDTSIEELTQIKGLGPMNIFGLKLPKAVLEIYQKEKIKKSLNLNSPEEIYRFLKEKIGKENKEFFVVLFFDSKNNLIVDNVSIGTLNASLVHPRELFQKAIYYNVSHVVISHNHPSGDPTPSKEDILVTKRLIRAGKIIGISIIDHLIITKNKYISLRNQLPDFQN